MSRISFGWIKVLEFLFAIFNALIITESEYKQEFIETWNWTHSHLLVKYPGDHHRTAQAMEHTLLHSSKYYFSCELKRLTSKVNFCASSGHVKNTDLLKTAPLWSVTSGWWGRESQTGQFVLLLCRLNGLQRYCNSDKRGESPLKYTHFDTEAGWFYSICSQMCWKKTVFHGLPPGVCVMANNIHNLWRFLCLHVNVTFA